MPTDPAPKTYLGVMVSSTFTDLEAHRAALVEGLSAADFKPIAMEGSSAQLNDVIDSSLRMVRDASAVILLISRKYGQTPADAVRNPESLSITELEFNEATRLGRPLLLFVMDASHPLTEADFEPDSVKREKLEAFRNRAKAHSETGVSRIYAVFDSLEDFRVKAERSLRQLQENIAASHIASAAAPSLATAPTTPPLPEPTPFILGRDADIAALTTALATPARILIHGTGGIGKTTLAQAVRIHSDISARYPSRPVVHLETVHDADAMRAAITRACGLPATATFAATLAHLAAQATLLLLDNLETPLHAEQAPTEAVLTQLCAIPTLAILATIRGTPGIRGSTWTRHEATVLDTANQMKLFLFHSAGAIGEADPDLPRFLAVLAGLPLAIELIALRAALDTSLADLWTQYQRIGPALAVRDGEPQGRLSALPTSIELSLASPRMGDPGRRLFALLGALPAGIADHDRNTLLGPEARPAFDQLRETGLAQRFSDRLDLLPPIRDHAARHHPPSDADATAVNAHYLELLVFEGHKRLSGTGVAPLARLIPDLPNITAAVHATSHVKASALRRLADAPWLQLYYGDLQSALGSLPNAARAYRAARNIATRTGNDRDLSVSHNRLGDILRAQGDLPAARASYQAGLAISERLAAADPANAERQRDLSVSHINLGDIQRALGDLQVARDSYEASLTTRKRLTTAEPANLLGQRDLSVCLDRLGDIHLAQQNYPAARASYQASLTIRESLATAAPANAEWQRDLAISLERLGAIHHAQGEFPATRASFQASLTIRERLAAADPANAQWQHDLAISYGNLGTVEPDPATALALIRRGRTIIQRLINLSTTDATLRRDLARFEADIARRTP